MKGWSADWDHFIVSHVTRVWQEWENSKEGKTMARYFRYKEKEGYCRNRHKVMNRDSTLDI